MSQDIKKGDRVRVTFEGEAQYANNAGVNVATRTLSGVRQTYTVLHKEGAKVEKLDPEPKFKVGDRVILRHLPEHGVGEVVHVTKPGSFEVVFPNKKYPPNCAVHTKGVGAGTFSARSLEPAPDQTFKLKAGDKIRNTITGRVGTVYRSLDDLKQLAVYDPRDWPSPQKSRVPAAAVEEYEEHRPGTYEIISRADGSPF